MTRKQELIDELNQIKAKEVEAQLIKEEELGKSSDAILKVKEAEAVLKTKKNESLAHNLIMGGDFLIKLMIAVFISLAFMHIVYSGSMAAVEDELIGSVSKKSSLFQLLSVVGPLFGMVLQYYFGTKKKSANGE